MPEKKLYLKDNEKSEIQFNVEKYSIVLEIPVSKEVLGFQPSDFNLELSTIKFPTSTFFVYFGVGVNLTEAKVLFSNNLPNLENHVFFPEEIQYVSPIFPFRIIILIASITSVM